MSGKLIFAPIAKLPDNWWLGTPKDNPSEVWTVWDTNTYYLWGANAGNYKQKPIGDILGGGGMAGARIGPSRGRSHPNYIGVNTMEIDHMGDNDAVFKDLAQKLQDGKDVVIPIFDDDHATPTTYKYSLGTGLGSDVDKWGDVQKYVFDLIVKLGKNAGSVDIPSGVYWPDCRKTKPHPRQPITSLADIQKIVDNVLTEATIDS